MLRASWAVVWPPSLPLCCALLSGLTVAEYFRDVEGQDVLLFVDNIFRFTQVRARSYQLGDCAGMD